MPERLAGQTVPCHDCGDDIRVPGGARRTGGRSGRPGQPTGHGLDPLVIGGGISTVIVVALLASMLLGEPTPETPLASNSGLKNPFSQLGIDLPPEATTDTATATVSNEGQPGNRATAIEQPDDPRPSDDLPADKIVTLPEKAVAWNWQPQKVEWTPGEMAKTPLRVWLGHGEPDQVRILPGGREVVVLHTVNRRSAYEAGGLVDNPGPQASVYDLKSGELLRQFDVPHIAAPAQRFSRPNLINFVRRDGLVAGSMREREERTQVYWSLLDGRRLESPDAQVGPPLDKVEPQFELTLEEFDEESHLKCINEKGELQWVIVSPESDPLEKLDPVRVAGIVGISRRSPDGAYVLVNCSNFLRVIEIATGQVVADVPIHDRVYRHDALKPVFRPDGLVLALFVDQIYTDSLVVWDLATGSEVTAFRVDESHGSYRWYDETHLIGIHGSPQEIRLLDLERHCLTWEIKAPDDLLPGRGLWCMSSKYGDPETIVNVAARIPGALQRVEQAMPEPLPLVVGPGTPVRLQIGSLSGSEQFRDELQELLEARIQSSGMVVSPNARVTLKATVENLSSKQKRVELNWFGIGSRDTGKPTSTTLTVSERRCVLELVDGTGASIAGADHEFSDDISRFGSVRVFQNAQAEIAERQEQIVVFNLQSAFNRGLPRAIYPQPRFGEKTEFDPLGRAGLGATIDLAERSFEESTKTFAEEAAKREAKQFTTKLRTHNTIAFVELAASQLANQRAVVAVGTPTECRGRNRFTMSSTNRTRSTTKMHELPASLRHSSCCAACRSE